MLTKYLTPDNQGRGGFQCDVHEVVTNRKGRDIRTFKSCAPRIEEGNKSLENRFFVLIKTNDLC